jgi:hypothetical protein
MEHDPLRNDAARPEQVDEDGFGEGLDHKPDSPEEELPPNYARGLDHHDVPGEKPQRRFSEGVEALPDTPEKEVERRFSEGVEQSPRST